MNLFPDRPRWSILHLGASVAAALAAAGLALGAFATALNTAPVSVDTTVSVSTGEIYIGQANLQPIDRSGVRAKITFIDDGSMLMVLGTATGLDPAQSYVTLIYDNGSLPGGPSACQPTIFNPFDPEFLLPTMFVGFWSVDADGNGTLNAINTNGGFNYVPLEKFRSTSVRLVTGPPPPGGSIPMTQLVACGHESDGFDEDD